MCGCACVQISRYQSVESLGAAWRGAVLVVQWVWSEGNSAGVAQ